MKNALDTNTILRFILKDNVVQHNKVKKILETVQTKDLFICYGVIIELYYVLKTIYKISTDKVLNILQDILITKEFQVECEIAVSLAIEKARKGLPFVDCLLGEVAALKNLKTITFDKGLNKDKNFQLI